MYSQTYLTPFKISKLSLDNLSNVGVGWVSETDQTFETAMIGAFQKLEKPVITESGAPLIDSQPIGDAIFDAPSDDAYGVRTDIWTLKVTIANKRIRFIILTFLCIQRRTVVAGRGARGAVGHKTGIRQATGRFGNGRLRIAARGQSVIRIVGHHIVRIATFATKNAARF
uniref:Uncharacterized protein n=1 Tax=Romanomermis culicivorax TaxID=13658 RepID=A0A915I422_ROMCU